MAGIRIIGPVALLTNGDMSQASLQSKAMDMLAFPFGALEAIWTGTPTGILKVEGSLDGTAFYPINVFVNNPAGSANSTLINMQGVGFRYMRLVYTRTSGTGSLTINGFAKAGGGS